MMIRAILSLLALLLPISAAHAAWQEASSDHFVIYADDTTRDIEAFTRRLERFHSAMEIVTGVQLGKPSPSNRVTVYVVRNEDEVRKLDDAQDTFVAGFYRPRAGGSIAVVPNVQVGGKVAEGTMVYLLHEYAHHFTAITSTYSPPRWMSEGIAEFFASASFEQNGNVMIGRPAVHRAFELYDAKNVTVEDLFDPKVYAAKKAKSAAYDEFYGKSWLLYHYLTFASARNGQMKKYVAALVAGQSLREAAQAAFGDFKQLDSELEVYMRHRMSVITIKHEGIVESPIVLRTLSAGEVAMMPFRVRSKVGVDAEKAKEIVVGARGVASRFPQDANVLAMLAEAEFDAGDHAAAVAAADRALALDPSQVNAYVQKGYALFELASKAQDEAKAYKEAVKPLLALNRLEPDHPLPLVYYFRGFVDRGAMPTPLAVSGLERAAELAPFDLDLRWMVAQQQIREGRYAAARRNLTPLAYYPHPNEASEQAKALLTQIDGKKDAAALVK